MAVRETVIALEGGATGRLLGRGAEDCLRVEENGIELNCSKFLLEPLRLPVSELAVVKVELGGRRAADGEGRFSILRRLSKTAVIPESEGIEGWLWTSSGGSALPVLVEGECAPNLALVFTHTLEEEFVARTFQPTFVTELGARSAYGVPRILGVLLRVSDSMAATHAFERLGVLRPLTDREVPPVMRRSLPTDRSADPAIARHLDSGRPSSKPPPGVTA